MLLPINVPTHYNIFDSFHGSSLKMGVTLIYVIFNSILLHSNLKDQKPIGPYTIRFV